MNESYIERFNAFLSEYNLSVEDKQPLLNMVVAMVEQEVKNYCNITEIPPELEHVIVKRGLGQLLKLIMQNGRTQEKANIQRSVRSITEGDVSYTYSNALNPDELLSAYIASLESFGLDELNSFRKMRW